MLKRLFAHLQKILPQHLITTVAGWMAESRVVWFKNLFIRSFMGIYKIDMSQALQEDPYAYPNFNEFFIRHLKPELRPIASSAHAIASPVDGTISNSGTVKKNLLLQAKQFYFNLETLLGNQMDLVQPFLDGQFITLYLAPHQYHRVHMPLTGKLKKTHYIPGKLFSVNRITTSIIPNIYSRNERLISLFETEAGPMAMILIGALVVGAIHTKWQKNVQNGEVYTKGEEIGYFKLGSSVMLLFAKESIQWDPSVIAHHSVLMGQFLGNIKKSLNSALD